METVKILRELWQRRAIVSVLAALVITLGIVLTHRLGIPPESRQYQVGVAGARILIDTPKSQFVEVAPLGAETLGQRANVLAALMAEGDVKAAIARKAGLLPDDLLAVSESAAEPQTVSPTKLGAADIHLLTTRVVRDSEGGQLPIIEVETQAPDPAGATRLVNAAVSGVREYLDSKAAGEQVKDRRRLQVTGLGINPGRAEVRGPGLLIGAGAGIFAFLFGCGLILLVSALSRGWREVEASEQQGERGQASPAASALRRDETDPVTQAPPPPGRAPAVRSRGWAHPERIEQGATQPGGAPDETAKSGAPPRAHDSKKTHVSSRPERTRRRSRTSSLPALGAATAEPAVTETRPRPAPPVKDKRSPDAGPGR